MNQLLKLPIGLTFSALNIQHNIIYIFHYSYLLVKKNQVSYMNSSFETMTPTRSQGITGLLKFVVAKSENHPALFEQSCG